MKIDSGKNYDVFLQFIVIGSVGGSRDNYRITWTDLERSRNHFLIYTLSLFTNALFMVSFLLITLFSVETARL